MCALLTIGVSGVRAYEATMADGTHICTTYGTFGQENVTEDKFTANEASGLEGFKIVSTNNNAVLQSAGPWYNIHYLGLKHSNGSETTNTLTLAAPDNYIIVGYTMTYCRFNGNRDYTITPAGGSSTTTSDNSIKTLTVDDVYSQNTTITIKALETSTLENNYFLIKTLTVVYAHLDNTMSTSKKYLVNNQRGGFLTTYSNSLCSTISGSRGNAKEFAIVEHNGHKYLYSATDSKYIAASDRRLTSVPSSEFSTTNTGNATYPIRPKLNSLDICTTLWKSSSEPTGYTDGIKIVEANDDEGIRYRMYDIGSFDASSLTSALDDFSATLTTLTVNKQQGDFMRSGSVNNDGSVGSSIWCDKWISSVPEAPVVTLSNSSYKISPNSTDKADLRDGTWTISVPVGYIITSYSITSTNNNGTENTVTSQADGVATTFPANTITTKNVPASGELGVRSTQFAVSSNSQFYTTIQITVKRQTSISLKTQLSNSKCYTIEAKEAARGGWAVANQGTMLTSTLATGLNIAYDNTDVKQQFAFIYYDGTNDNVDNGSYYLYSVSEHKFASASGTNNNDVVNLSDAAFQTVNLLSTGDTSFPVCVEMSNTADLNVCTSGNSPGVVVYGTSGAHSDDGGNAVVIYEAGDFDATDALAQIANTVSVNYQIVYNGENKAEADVYALKGSILSIPTSIAKKYCTYRYYSDAECNDEIMVVPNEGGTVYAKEIFPFEISSDFENAKWYFVQMRGKWIKYESSSVSGVDVQETGDAGQWAFLGDPYTSIQIINKNANSGNYLTYSGTTLQFNSTATNWTIAAHPSTYVTGFWIYELVSGTYHIPYAGSDGAVTAYSNTVGLTAGNDGNSSQGGGAWVVTAVPDDYSDMVAANIQPYIDNAEDDVCFKISEDDANTLSSAITSASTGGISLDEYNSLLVDLNGYIKYPSTGYYRMVNHEGGYAGATSSPARIIDSGAYAASTILYLTKNGSANKYTVQVQGKYFGAPDQYTDVTLKTTPLEFTPAVAAPGYASFKADGTGLYGYIGLDGDNNLEGAAATGIDANPKAYWAVEPATEFTGSLTNANDNTGTGHSYASLCVPFAISSLSGASAYSPTINDKMLSMGDGESTVAAGTPVVLIGATDAGSYTATINTESAPVTAVAATNALSGNFTGTSLDCTAARGTNYVLGFDASNNNRIGFYHVNNASFPLSANRAYLVIAKNEGSSNVKGFAINFDLPTTVDALNVQDTRQGTIYNIAGQRVNKVQKGLYIVNGKKILVK